MVVIILSNREYTGAAILSLKMSKAYKDHLKYVKPEIEWILINSVEVSEAEYTHQL